MSDQDPAPYAGLGQINRLQGNHLAAAQVLREGLEAFPRFRALHYELALTLVAVGRLDDAGEHFANAANGKNLLPSANIGYGKYLLLVGRLAEAADQFEMALSRRPDDDEAKCGLAQARGEMPIDVNWDEKPAGDNPQ